MSTLFSWNDTGNEETPNYETGRWTPAVFRPTEMRGQVAPLLSGGSFLQAQVGEDGAAIIPEAVRLTWEWADPVLLPIVEATYRNLREVTVTYPWRGSTASITGRVVQCREEPRAGRVVALEVVVQEIGI